MNANHFIIKHASQEDIPALTAIERECFPAAEAASEEEIAARVHAYGKHFWLLFCQYNLAEKFQAAKLLKSMLHQKQPR